MADANPSASLDVASALDDVSSEVYGLNAAIIASLADSASPPNARPSAAERQRSEEEMVQAAINESLLDAHHSSETLLSDESISAAELEFARLASLEKSEGGGSAGEPAKRAKKMPKILADEVRRDRAEVTRGQCRPPSRPLPFSRASQATELPILEALSTCAPSPLMLARSAIILRRRANAARSRLSMQTPPPAGQPSLRRAAASAPTPTTRATPARERTRSGVSPASPQRAAPPPAPAAAAAAATPSAADGTALTEHEMRIMKGRELLGSRRDETAPRLRRDDAEIMPRCFRDDAEMNDRVSRFYTYRLAHLKLREVHVDGDGNCQFRALSQQLFGDDAHHEAVRAEVVAHIRKEKAFFSAMFDGAEFDRYADTMGRRAPRVVVAPLPL